MIEAIFHLLDVIEHFFSARTCCRERNECTSFVDVLELYVEWRQAQQFNVKRVFFDLSCAYEHCLANVKAHKFSMSCRSGIMLVSNFSESVIINIRSFH